ncbi:MAG: glycosyltransferase [Blautia sp.]|nr:glycosyltransferase [Blautia sp.]
MDQPLVSVIVICYKNLSKIYDTLDSILKQDYPRIEILIHDDGTPEYEGEWRKIEGYVKKNRTPNIVSFLMEHLEKNVGTSRNCNHAIFMSHGRYIKFISPEDELYSTDVLSQCVEYAEKHRARIVAGQTYVKRRYGEAEDKVRQTVVYRWRARHGRLCNLTPTDHDIRYMQGLNREKAKEILTSRCVLSTVAVFFHRELLEETGGFLEDYRLIEDVSYWPYIAMKDEKFYFTNIIMMKYALSGCSNGGSGNAEFNRDFSDIMKCTYIPNEKGGGVFNKTLKRIRMRQTDYIYATGHSIKDKIMFLDVQMYLLLRNIKYILIGTRI